MIKRITKLLDGMEIYDADLTSAMFSHIHDMGEIEIKFSALIYGFDYNEETYDTFYNALSVFPEEFFDSKYCIRLEKDYFQIYNETQTAHVIFFHSSVVWGGAHTRPLGQYQPLDEANAKRITRLFAEEDTLKSFEQL